MAASRSVGGACARRRFARAYRQLRPRDGQCESDRAGCDRQPPFLPRTRGRSLFAVASTRIRIRSRRSSDPATTRFPSRNARESSVSARLANAKAIIYCWLSSSSPTGRHNYGPPALGGKRGNIYIILCASEPVIEIAGRIYYVTNDFFRCCDTV